MWMLHGVTPRASWIRPATCLGAAVSLALAASAHAGSTVNAKPINAAAHTPQCVAPSCVTAVAANGHPTGGRVVSGAGSISQSGSVTDVQQSSGDLVIDWLSFSIGSQATVDFLQPSASAIAVNQILSANGSQILGHLNANGQVWLVNPNGVLFGQGAQVNVGGLVASTLDVSDPASSGNTRSFGGDGAGSVMNLGTINAANGGYVALLGNQVGNQGTITARLGTVALGAGSAATLTFDVNRLVKMQVDQNTLKTLAQNGGLIEADGGRVIMSAGARDALLASVVNNSGVIEARTAQNHEGTITLLGGMTAGTVNVGGTLDASAADGRAGGSIETSAAHVEVANGSKVTTAAPQGQYGTWLIDPTDFTVAPSGGDITGATLSADLNSTNFTIRSSNGHSPVTGGGNGDNINVNDIVSWSANTTLTLTAANNININDNVTATGTGARITLQPDTANGAEAASGSGTSNIASGITVALNAGTFAFSHGLNLFGTIRGGTLVSGDATPLDSSNYGTLNGVTLGNATSHSLTLTPGGYLLIANGLNLYKGFNFNIGNNALYFEGSVYGSGASAAPNIAAVGAANATATINTAGGSIDTFNYPASTEVLTIGAGVTIQGFGEITDDSTGPYAQSIVNHGAIAGNTAGQTLTISPYAFTSAGALSVSAGTLSITPTSYTNTGTTNVSGGTLNLGGALTTSSIGGSAFTRTGGSVDLSGRLNNTGNTLDIGSTGIFGTGGLTGFSGTIAGGTLVSGDATQLYTGSQGTLNGVTLGNAASHALTLTPGGSLTIVNGLSLYNGFTFNIGNTALYFEGPYFSAGASATPGIAAVGAANPTATINTAGGSIDTLNYPVSTEVLTIGAGVTIQGFGEITDYTTGPYGQSIVNNGAIAGYTAQTLTISPYAFTNNGTLSVSSGTLSVTPAFTYTNTGTTIVSGGTLNLGGALTMSSISGAAFDRGGGSVDLSGTLNNTGNTLDIGSTGIFGTGGLTQFSGTIVGGTLLSGDATPLYTGGQGTLNGVTLGNAASHSLTLTPGGSLTIVNGLSLYNGFTFNTGNNALYFEGPYFSNGASATPNIAAVGAANATATINMAGGSIQTLNYPASTEVLTIGAGVTIQGFGEITDYSTGPYGQSIVNNGTIAGNTAGQTLTISPDSFTDNGALTVASGAALQWAGAGQTVSAGGSVSGAGTLLVSSGTNTVDGAVNVGIYDQTGGTVSQIAAALPSFAAANFTITGGTFIRALGGTGAAATPYQLTDVYGLQGMGSAGMLNKSYTMANSINLEPTVSWNGGAGFAPIGSSTTAFTGSFNGAQFTLSNLIVNLPSTADVGLFGAIGAAAVIQNVGLIGGSVNGGANSGMLVGLNGGTLSNDYAAGGVSGIGSVGGLVGSNTGAIINSYATGTVTGTGSEVGGLVGSNIGTISNSYATGGVSGAGSVGGLVGSNTGSISNSYATGAVTATGAEVGGLVGDNEMTITDSYSLGDPTGTASVGGLAGKAGSGATASGSFWNTTTSGLSSSAGGVGMTTAQMQQQANFTSATSANGNVNPNWIFTGTWVMYNGYTYPLLSSFMTPLTVTANNDVTTYNGTAFSGGNGVTYSTPPVANLLGTVSYSGTSQGAVNAGGYVITPGGLYSNQQGYIISFDSGTLTVNPATLTLSGLTGTNRTYNGTVVDALAGTAVLNGLVGTDTLVLGNDTNGTLGSKNVGSEAVTTAVTLANGTGLASNYTLTQPTLANVTISPAALTISAVTDSKTYDGTTNSSQTPTVTVGTVFSGDTLSALTQSFASKNVLGTNGSTLNVNSYTINDGNNGNNYSVTVQSATGTITPLASVAWVGGASGNWSTASNWAGGIIPDLSNVLAVTIPAGKTVTYDSGVGNTMLSTLTDSGNLIMAAGNLSTTGNMSTAGFQQSGGTLNVGGTLTIKSTGGGVTLGDIAAGALTVTSKAGAITQLAATDLDVTGATTLTADNGLTGPSAVYYGITLANAGNQFVGAVTSTGSNIDLLQNTGGLTLGATAANGTFTADSLAGAITQSTGKALDVTGAASLTADNGLSGASDVKYGITLAHTTNSLAGTVVADGSAITLDDAAALTAVLDSSGASTLTSVGAMTVSGTVGTLLKTTTTGTNAATTFGATTVGTSLTVVSTGAVTETSSNILTVHGEGTTTVSNPKVTVNGVVGAEIPAP